MEYHDTDMLKGYALIIGPSDTPYFGGYYFFEISYPTDYPHKPPVIKYCTNGNNIRFNPNLYTCGKVCVSLLNTWRGDQWTSCQTISTVLLTLCTLLCKDPLLNEPGVDKNNSDMNNYNDIIEFANLSIAICDVVAKKPNVYMDFFEYFYPYIKETFNANFDKFIEISEKNNAKFNNSALILTTKYYGMNVQIDYNKLIEKLKETKNLLKIM